ncbi:MAG: baseplate J/gp47 family protein [Sulfurospirillum sp.]|nr:baseplate J/gp47 family protein [Sulfurospirillum sp.]
MEVENLIEELDYQTLKNEIVTHVKEQFNEDLTFIESDSFSLIVEAWIFRELQLRSKLNQTLRDAFAMINTDDTDNTAGSEMAYRRAINSVDEGILDIKITSPIPGQVLVIYHHANDITALIQNHLDLDEVRPLSDIVTVQKASVITVDIALHVTVLQGVDTSILEQKIRASFDSIVFKIGENLTTSRVIATAFKEGVYRVQTDFITTEIEPSQVLDLNLSFSYEVLA